MKLYLLRIVESFENYIYCEVLSLIVMKLCSAFVCSDLSGINGIRGKCKDVAAVTFFDMDTLYIVHGAKFEVQRKQDLKCPYI